MSQHALLLNASYEPLRPTSIKRAMRLVLDGKAEIVESEVDNPIRSAGREFARPAVIRLVRYVHVPRRYRRSVSNVILFNRDHRRCAWCNRHERDLRDREFLTRDHLVPTSRGGQNVWENVITSCNTCNHKKGNQLAAELGWKMHFHPGVPHFVNMHWVVRKLTPLQERYLAQFFPDLLDEIKEAQR